MCLGVWFVTSLLDVSRAAAKTPWRDYLSHDDAWFRTAHAGQLAENILSFQSLQGSWPKNIDTTAERYHGKPEALRGTFDNGATRGELRFLARIARATGDEQYKAAFLKGLDHVLAAQYPTGGWPQYFPPGNSYAQYITFNDGTMVGLMELMREVCSSADYQFVDARRRKQAEESFERGVRCILRCQIEIAGQPAVWCAQHDQIDYRPRPARSFELASLSGYESVGIVELLMSLEPPSPEVIRAVDGAIRWFERVRLTGIRVDRVPDAKSPTGFDKVVVADPAALPLWARFYDLETGKPIFCDRDGVARANLADISYERRNGYDWLGDWPQRLLERDYPAWRARYSR